MPDVFMQALELSTLDEQQSESESGEHAPNDKSQFFLHTAVRKIFAYQKAHPGNEDGFFV